MNKQLTHERREDAYYGVLIKTLAPTKEVGAHEQSPPYGY